MRVPLSKFSHVRLLSTFTILGSGIVEKDVSTGSIRRD